jgi:hypothetical protein
MGQPTSGAARNVRTFYEKQRPKGRGFVPTKPIAESTDKSFDGFHSFDANAPSSSSVQHTSGSKSALYGDKFVEAGEGDSNESSSEETSNNDGDDDDEEDEDEPSAEKKKRGIKGKKSLVRLVLN